MKWLKNISENLVAKAASPLAEEGLIDKDIVKQAVIHNDQESRKQIARAHKDALKGSIAGASMVGGFFNPFGFLGDLGITTTSTLADTAVEGNTKQLPKDLIINLGSDLIGHGIGKALSKIIKEIKPTSIQDVINYIKDPYNKSLITDDLVQLIDKDAPENLEELYKLIPYHTGELGLVRPIIDYKLNRLNGFHVDLNDAMQKMRHGNTPDSKFIKEATEVIDNAWNKYLSTGGNNALSVRHLPTESKPAKKYISHGISLSDFKRALQREGNAIMPSLAILPQNTNTPWGDVVFIGKPDLLKSSKIYAEDAWTPTVSMVENAAEKSDNQILQEMLQIQNKRTTPEISLQDVENTKWTREFPTKEVKEQNSFTEWFFRNISTDAVPGQTPYMEAKYQGFIPFASFNHALIPEDAVEVINWAQKNNVPFSTYSIFNKGENLRRYEMLQKLLEDSDLLFNSGGKLNPYTK